MNRREEILKMEPGRRLDSEVGLHVMGFPEITIVGSYYFTDPIDTLLKPYSTDVSAAWEVIKKVEIEWAWDMSMHNSSNEVDVYIGKKFYTSMNVPEAICKAALLAVLGL